MLTARRDLRDDDGSLLLHAKSPCVGEILIGERVPEELRHEIHLTDAEGPAA